MKPPIDTNYPTYTQRFHLRRQLIDELTADIASDRSRYLYGTTVKPTSIDWNWEKCTDDQRSETLSTSLPDTITHRLRYQLHSVRLHKITNLSGWLDYCTKQIETYGYPNGFRTPCLDKRDAA